MRRFWKVTWAVAAVVLLLPAGARTAHAGGDEAKIAQLDQQALSQYDNLDFDQAKATLESALAIVKQAGLENDEAAARTHMELGILYVGGYKDKYKGLQHFERALVIDPDIKVDPDHATPEMESVFNDAKQAVSGMQQAEGGGSGANEGNGNGGGAGNEGNAGGGNEGNTGGAGNEGNAGTASAGGGASGVQGLAVNEIDQVNAGKPVALQVQVGSDIAPQTASVKAYYRVNGQVDYTPLPLGEPDARGNLTGKIPGSAVNGKTLYYYLEADNAAGQPVAMQGNSGSPLLATIVGMGTSSDEGNGENPLGDEGAGGDQGGGGGSTAATVAVTSSPGRRHVLIVVAVGTGGGYAGGKTEVTNSPIKCCFAPTLFHIAPEISFFLTPRLTLGVVGRIQVVTGANATLTTTGGTTESAANAAVAGMARIRYYVTGGNTQVYVHGDAGGGYIRQRVPLSDLSGETNAHGTADTALGGPILVGGGVGIAAGLSHVAALTAELSALALFPHFSVNADINLGISLAF